MIRRLFHWWIFYPAAVLVAAAVILFSLGPALLPADPRPVAGRMDGRALVIEGADLAHPAASPETMFYVARNAAWAAEGLRVAVRPGLGAPQQDEAGTQVLLAPEAAVGLGPGPFRVEVHLAPVPVTTAPQLAIALDRGGAIEWRTVPVTAVTDVVRLDFPQDEAGMLLTGVGIRPVATLQDYNYGVEIRSIRIIPTGPGAA
ncbi:MAG: hypothetical protein AB7J28_12870 [Hyphomonadaceae bacterium]